MKKNFYFAVKCVAGILLFFGTLSLNAQTIHISDRAGLEAMSDNDSADYVLDNDIDLGDSEWTPLYSDGSFRGTLDGQGHKILNLTITSGENIGLFYLLDNGSEVKNLGFSNVNITGSQKAGAIAGLAGSAIITKCFVDSGNITTSGELVGGLLGLTYGITVDGCYSNADVTGSAHVGGIIGHMNGGVVQNCHVDAVVYATNIASGGIVGWPRDIDGVIKNCYAKGKVVAVNGFAGGIAGVADDPDHNIEIDDCIAAQDSILIGTAPGGNRIIGIAGAPSYNVSNNYALDTIPGTWTDDASGLDGATITSEQFLDVNFFADNLPNWDFGTFGDPIWQMTVVGPLLAWEETPTAVPLTKLNSQAKVYVSNGQIHIDNAEENATIRIYSITGVLLQETKASSSSNVFNVKGFVIIEVESTKNRGTFKVVNFQ